MIEDRSVIRDPGPEGDLRLLVSRGGLEGLRWTILDRLEPPGRREAERAEE
jgi:hypothetical protein